MMMLGELLGAVDSIEYAADIKIVTIDTSSSHVAHCFF